MIEQWHQVLATRDTTRLEQLLANDVVLHSPVVHSLIKGNKLVALYLQAALHTFLNDSFRYVRKFDNGLNHVLEFEVEIDGIFVNGVDMITFDQQGQIVDFKVMVRPLQAVNKIHTMMGKMLEKLA